jgi:hypothetical protein
VHGEAAYAYTALENVKQGSNISIETLQEILLDLKTRGRLLDRKLFFQLDNTSKQCKSKYMLGWLAALVLFGVFDEIVLSFLPVGHTHEDIDQFFSRLAIYLRGHNARSRQELAEAITKCYTMPDTETPVPITGHIEKAANISDWLGSRLQKTTKTRTRQGISGYHQFRFTPLEGKRNVKMEVRRWSTGTEADWRGLKDFTFHHVVFKDDSTDQKAGKENKEGDEGNSDESDKGEEASEGDEGDGGEEDNKNQNGEEDDAKDNGAPQSGNRAPMLKDFLQVSAAQRPLCGPGEKWVSVADRTKHDKRLRNNVEQVIIARDVPDPHKQDLRTCLTMIEDQSAMPFHWDMSFFNSFDEHALRDPVAGHVCVCVCVCLCVCVCVCVCVFECA